MNGELHKTIADKVLHTLSVYPRISPSMLQISLGSGIPTAIWHEILDEMVEEQRVYRYNVSVITPSGRSQTQTVISKDPPDPTDDRIVDDNA